MIKYRYGCNARPPFSFGVPNGWALVERQKSTAFQDPAWRRLDLPVSREFAFGVIEYDRELSKDEVSKYDLTALGPAEAIADERAL